LLLQLFCVLLDLRLMFSHRDWRFLIVCLAKKSCIFHLLLLFRRRPSDRSSRVIFFVPQRFESCTGLFRFLLGFKYVVGVSLLLLLKCCDLGLLCKNVFFQLLDFYCFSLNLGFAFSKSIVYILIFFICFCEFITN
jgi:hypothetical protein